MDRWNRENKNRSMAGRKTRMPKTKLTTKAFGIEPGRMPYQLRQARYYDLGVDCAAWASDHFARSGRSLDLLDIGPYDGVTRMYTEVHPGGEHVRYHGVDLFPKGEQFVYKHESWTFHRLNLEQGLPGLETDRYDVVVCEQVLEHLRKPEVVLADAGYGTDTQFRTSLTALELPYVLGIMSTVTVWKPGQQPPAAPRGKGRGRPPKLLRRGPNHAPRAVKDLARSLPVTAWQTVSWRPGVKKRLRSRFAAVQVRPDHRDYWRTAPYPEEWLLIEWPRSEPEPTKYWLSTLPADIALRELVRLAKHRWIIERDYEELKQELGLSHFEGRGWRGFHHHAILCLAAYGFLVAERNRFSPSARAGQLDLSASPLPPAFQPRGRPARLRTA